MKKTLMLVVAALVLATQAFASYVIVMKDGTRYKAKSRWTMQNGKAIITLESGSVMAVDPNLIDAAKSDEITKLGLGDVAVLGQETAPQKQESLGSSIRLRQPRSTPPPAPPPVKATAPAAGAAPAAEVPSGANGVAADVIDKFERAFENVGIFEHKMTAPSPRALRAELTVDSEDKVFNAISATSFLMVHMPGVQIDMVELFMKTTNGGAAGRFQMSHADAENLDTKKITQQDYFVRNVIY